MRVRGPAWLASTFVAFAAPPYRVFWASVLTSYAGLWAAMVSRGFLVFDLTESSAALGAASLALGAALLVGSPVGGLVADRLPKHGVSVSGHWALAVLSGVQALLIVAGVIEFWMLVVASAIEGATVAILIPARQALTGEVVPEDRLGNAMALQEVSFNLARVIAPVATGAVIAVAVLGVSGAFVLHTGLHALSAALLMLVPRRRGEAPRVATTAPLDDLLDGIRYVRRRPAMLILALVAYGVAVTGMPYIFFLPAVTADVFGRGAVELGVLTAAVAVGAVVASIVAAAIADRAAAWRVHLLSPLAFGLLLVVFAVAPGFEAALLVGVLLGAAETGFVALNYSLAMRYAHPAYYGRMQAVVNLGFALSGLLALPLGFVADAAGLRATLAAMGLAGFATIALVAVLARRLDAAADAHPPRAGDPAILPRAPAGEEAT